MGYRKDGTSYRVVSSDDSEMFTCDRPMCSECATRTGTMFFPKDFESIDECHQCVNSGDSRVGINPISREEAISIRRQMWSRSVGMLRVVSA